MNTWCRYFRVAAINWRHYILLEAAALILLATGAVLAQGGTWTNKTDMSTARLGHAEGVVNGKIYAIGGHLQGGAVISTVEEYDPVTDTWIAKSPMPTARVGASAGVVEEKIYIFGGQAVVLGPSLTTVEMYDPATDTWDTTLTNMPSGRSLLYGSASVIDGKIYIIGGQGGPGNTPDSSIVVYDPVTDTWDTTKADIPTPRVIPAMSVVNGKIYVIGGATSGDFESKGLNTVEAYDPATDTWDTTLTEMPTPRAQMISSAMNGMIFTIGGISGFTGTATFYAKVEAYDPATDTWDDNFTAMPTPRYGLTNGVLNGKIYAIGGNESGFIASSKVEELTFSIVSVEDNVSIGPVSFALHQNYPNPFNPATTIRFDIPERLSEEARVQLKIYNLLGELVRTLVDEQKFPGHYTVEWDGKNHRSEPVASGIYIYRLTAGEFKQTRRMLLLK